MLLSITFVIEMPLNAAPAPTRVLLVPSVIATTAASVMSAASATTIVSVRRDILRASFQTCAHQTRSGSVAFPSAGNPTGGGGHSRPSRYDIRGYSVGRISPQQPGQDVDCLWVALTECGVRKFDLPAKRPVLTTNTTPVAPRPTPASDQWAHPTRPRIRIARPRGGRESFPYLYIYMGLAARRRAPPMTRSARPNCAAISMRTGFTHPTGQEPLELAPGERLFRSAGQARSGKPVICGIYRFENCIHRPQDG